MFSYPCCCICVSEGFLLDTDRFEVEYCQILEEFLFTRVLDAERVQLVKESFSKVIYVPCIDIFHSFTACSWISLQIEMFVGKSVTFKAAKRLEDCINVVHGAYVVVLS